VLIDGAKFAALAEAWPAFAGVGVHAAEVPSAGGASGAARTHPDAGRTVELVGVRGGLRPSWWTLTDRVLRQKLNTPADTRARGTDRQLGDERMVVRPPRGWDGRSAVGVLVFVHAAPLGVIPEAIAPAADELGLVCVSAANAGNDRPAADRYQLTLDAIQTVRERYPVDDERVYVCGLSGGGKVSTHVWAGFPEIVRGAGPVVAVGSYEHLRRDDGQYWRGDFPKPAPATMKVLKERRLAAITGDRDGNQDYIRRALRVMEGDGLDVRLFDYAGMGHEMATPERFAEALRWVDEPARTRGAEREARAAALMKEAAAEPSRRAELLERAMDAAPLSATAWRAWDALNTPAPSGDAAHR
jgi:predicted esterase